MAFPLLAAGALLAPLVGGAMSLAGGALSMAGGLTHAASTASGMAWDVGKGAMGAAGGMLGGGKSGNVEDTSVVAADQSRSDALGRKALPPGTKLNKAGVLVQDKGDIVPGKFGADGNLLGFEGGRMPPPDRSGASPIQQILDHVKYIGANTARTAAGMSSLISTMALLLMS